MKLVFNHRRSTRFSFFPKCAVIAESRRNNCQSTLRRLLDEFAGERGSEGGWRKAVQLCARISNIAIKALSGRGTHEAIGKNIDAYFFAHAHSYFPVLLECVCQVSKAISLDHLAVVMGNGGGVADSEN